MTSTSLSSHIVRSNSIHGGMFWAYTKVASTFQFGKKLHSAYKHTSTAWMGRYVKSVCDMYVMLHNVCMLLYVNVWFTCAAITITAFNLSWRVYSA
jgi:hypothetical protein